MDVVRLNWPIKPNEPSVRSARRWLFARRTCVMLPPTLPGNSEKGPASNSEKTILFADDDGQLQKFIAALLHKFGYKVIVARDGKDALQKARDFDGIIHLL